MTVRNIVLFFLVILVWPAGTVSLAAEGEAPQSNAERGGMPSQRAQAFVGEDLHLAGGELTTYQPSTGQHALVFRKRFSMSIGANRLSSDGAVVQLESVRTEFRGHVRIYYRTWVYLQGNVSVKKGAGAETSDLSEAVIEKGESMVVRFSVRGEVFVTAEKREVGDPHGLEIYSKAVAAVESTKPKLVIEVEAPIPELVPEEKIEERPKKVVAVKPKKPGLVERIFAPKKPKKPAKPKKPMEPAEKAVAEVPEKKPSFIYPVNISPAGEVPLKIEQTKEADGTYIATLTQRFYLWQKQDERGGLLELQADSAVIFYSEQALKAYEEARAAGTAEEFLASGAVKAIYLAGDVIMTEGQRTIRADEIYYDFRRKKAVAVNAVMRNFDALRGIPIYVRAAKLRQVAENKFTAEDITLTSSEFYLPQISLRAASVSITDTTPVDEQAGRVSNSSYDAEMRDIRLKMYDKTIFRWPYLRSNLQRPDVPLKSLHVGHDSTWGTLIETRWYLSRLLGLKEPEGTDSTLALDYYSKRGMGVGAEITYAREKYFGRLLGYVLNDSGEDDLGRNAMLRNRKPPRELRGRFRWQHRHFLPHNWQLTAEVSYASDMNFIQGFYRREFDVGKEQETLVHLKRIQDNWGLSILNKVRINSFVNKVEELPTIEYHLTGQSVFDDRFTLYSDSQVSRFRHLFGPGAKPLNGKHRGGGQQFFTFMSQRAELDMPMRAGKLKLVPYVAGTFGYDDQLGFNTDINGRLRSRKNKALLGEIGARVSRQAYWKVYPEVKSRLWDLNKLRHIIEPQVTTAFYTASDSVFDQRNVLNTGISQRLQTKRGPAGKERTVDWMRLDTDFTWVSDSGSAMSGPDRFIWNKPFIPLANTYSPIAAPGFRPLDRRSSTMLGARRNYFGADYIWRVSDTTAILSDMNYDMQSGVVQQFNIGFSHMRWPNLSYYIGSRYLRRFRNGFGEKGSNAFVFAATYLLDPRYTLVFAQQLDFDYGATVRSDIALIRRYHRMYWAITYSADESLRSQAIAFSVWPQGVPETVLGSRRYTGLGSLSSY